MYAGAEKGLAASSDVSVGFAHAGVLLQVLLWVGQLEHDLSPTELEGWR